jgi:hypothetical protein
MSDLVTSIRTRIAILLYNTALHIEPRIQATLNNAVEERARILNSRPQTTRMQNGQPIPFDAWERYVATKAAEQ